MGKTIIFMAAMAMFVLQGCAPEVKTNTLAQFNAEYQRVKGQGYLIQPGDTLDITFFYTPEYNATSVPVRPDGKIQLSLVGDFPVTGKTPDQVGNELKQVYSSQLKNPDLAVIVKTFGANFVTIQGEVKVPGQVPLSGNETVIQIIGKAGSFTKDADPKNVTVVRRSNPGKAMVVVLDLKSALQGVNPGMDVPVLPGDQIFVATTQTPNGGGSGRGPPPIEPNPTISPAQ